MVRSNRMERKLADKRRRILGAARHLFGRRSFTETSMRQIADGADVAVGTLYRYFSDKVAIAEALSTEDLELESRHAFATLPEGGVHQQLMYVFGAFFAHHRADVGLARLVVKELSLADDEGSAQREQRFMELFIQLTSLVEAAKGSGELAPDVAAFDVAVNAFGLYYFYLVGWLSGQPGFDPPEPHVDRALALLLRGLDHTAGGEDE